MGSFAGAAIPLSTERCRIRPSGLCQPSAQIWAIMTELGAADPRKVSLGVRNTCCRLMLCIRSLIRSNCSIYLIQLSNYAVNCVIL